MAYTNETTHYSIPLPLGSDLTTPMDYNESMQDVDTALFEAKTDSGSALQKANQLQLDLATTNDNVTAVTGRVTTLEGTTTTQGQAIIQNTQDIADVRADALDMIVAKDEGTAQVATVAVNKGEYFRYNDVLYIATSNIAIGDTIVPNENCKATNVGTELTQVNSDLTERSTTTPTFTRDSSTLYNLEENRTYFGRRGPVNNLLLALATPDVVNAGTTAFPYKMSGVELPSNYIRTPLMRETTIDNENVVYGWAQISSGGLIAIYNDVAIPQNVEVLAQFTW